MGLRVRRVMDLGCGKKPQDWGRAEKFGRVGRGGLSGYESDVFRK